MNPQEPIALAPSVPALPKAKDLFMHSYQYYQQNFLLILGIFSIPFLLGLLAMLPIPEVLAALYPLFLVIVSVWASISLSYVITKSGDAKLTVMEAYRRSWKYFFPSIWIGILAALPVMGGFVLFAIPGFYLSVMLIFAGYVLFTEDKRGMSALVQSWHYVKGRWGSIFWKILLAGLVVAIPFFVITFLSIPFSHQQLNLMTGKTETVLPAFSTILLKLMDVVFAGPLIAIYAFSLLKSAAAMTAPLAPEREARIRKKIKIWMVIGIVVLVLLSIGFFWTLGQKPPATWNVSFSSSSASALGAFNPLFHFGQ